MGYEDVGFTGIRYFHGIILLCIVRLLILKSRVQTKMDIPHPSALFRGFPENFAEFLFLLQFNNTIDRLQGNKPVYKRLITEPLTMLFHTLTPVALSVSETVITKPSKCVSNMYSDMRFSRSTPLKGYMYIRFREPFGEKDILGLYFDMGCDYYGFGIRVYKQSSAGMEKIREYAIKNYILFTRELDNLALQNMKIIGENYASDRYPEIKNAALNDFLNKKGFYIEQARPINEAVYNGKLRDEIVEAYIGLKGLYTQLRNALYS